ncbi:PilZ domain-containing protein [Halorhodospira halophila]|uniref:Type IV pilus assembly PilZ n=1 Tax=Halorhodospira halophila (strain DSM 244 / SL1) TaxID=349124 RepID=A1WVL9_HALHL|nr:PilZ domain-containing protein [Halorhodospira halophila]ABM61731.1 type IV pilus assembly PilZ [Halorhodospira halophila SL1]MBK1728939.1 PilZ domain-containing protein [Halorhodospira halophila]
MNQSGGKTGYRPQIQRLRRGEKRSHLLYYLPVHDGNDGGRLGVLGDLSADGLLLIGNRAFTPGQRLQLQIRGEPGSEIAGDVRIDVTVEARWSAPDLNPAYTATGVRFVGLDEATRSAIEGLLHDLGLLAGVDDEDETGGQA